MEVRLHFLGGQQCGAGLRGWASDGLLGAEVSEQFCI